MERTPARHVVDTMVYSFAVAKSESEWLLTLLTEAELRYIFEGRDDSATP